MYSPYSDSELLQTVYGAWSGYRCASAQYVALSTFWWWSTWCLEGKIGSY